MFLKVKPFKISMVAGVVSKKIIPVEKYCEGLGTEKKIKRLIKDTGFQKLSIAEPGVCASDMCCQAAEKILESARIDRKSIGALIFISQTPDYLAPSTAYVLQKRLNLPSSLVAFDVNLGCSGFVYGLYISSMLLSSMDNKKVLLCCGDVCSSAMNPASPGKRAITGDAGTCVLLEPDLNGKDNIFNIDSYGERFDALYVPNGGRRNPLTMRDNKVDEENQDNFSVMDGLAILDFSMNEVYGNIKELLAYRNIEQSDVGTVLFHQPNYILIKALQDRLRFSSEQVIHNSQNIGNTSSASIPLLLTEIGDDWRKRNNSVVLLSGFGIGLSVASLVLNMEETVCIKTMEYDSVYTYKNIYSK